MAINIVFDGPPRPEAGRFVEVENDAGASINAGEWSEREDGYWQLRITSIPTEVAEDFDAVKSPLYDESKHIDNLETLVVRLARYIEKVSDGDSKLADQAMGYMRRQARGAQSILREF